MTTFATIAFTKNIEIVDSVRGRFMYEKDKSYNVELTEARHHIAAGVASPQRVTAVGEEDAVPLSILESLNDLHTQTHADIAAAEAQRVTAELAASLPPPAPAPASDEGVEQ